RRSEESELGELADDSGVDRLGAVPRRRVWRDLRIAELARRPPNQLLLGCEREVQGSRGGPQKSPAERVSLSSTSPTGRLGLAPSSVARRGFDLLASRARREPQCTHRDGYSARAAGIETRALCEEMLSGAWHRGARHRALLALEHFRIGGPTNLVA